ncbi:MAG: hypothetical protein KDK70_08250 [Myxococcales bacterium]|nr:hypothetical protein [Myxococcales bacterium]
MHRLARATLWFYIAFNLAITVTLVVAPEVVDTPYLGGPLTPTRRFQWFSVATLHLVVVGMTLTSLSMKRAAERRRLHLVNGAFYLWDAATQLIYWGDAIGVAPHDLYTNAGVSAAVGVAMLAVWWTDRVDVPAPGAAPTRPS